MKSDSFRRTKVVALLCVGAGALACVLLIRGQVAEAGQQGTAAKSAAVSAAASTDEPVENSSGATDDDGPSPGNFLGATFVPSIPAPDLPPGTQTAMVAPPPPPPPKPADAGGDAARQQVNNETANLLAMAYALKAEVDKTNQDQLSIAVVRKANQIEQLARKVRDDMRPAMSRN